jgi:CDP-diacylglycerol--serine O-phosphatidyltransferase
MMKKRKAFVGFWHYGVILTYISLASAVVGICFSVGGAKEPIPWVGILCLFISGLCDAFDGIVARTRKNRTHEDCMFGERIDSLSDLIAFGVAPAMIGFGMEINRWFYIPVYVIYVLCGLVRLAYFDVTEQIRTQDPNCGKRTYYEGLPITAAAVFLPIFYLIATLFDPYSVGRNVVMLGGYLVLSLLFILRFKMPKPGPKGILALIGALAVVLAGLIGLHIFLS